MSRIEEAIWCIVDRICAVVFMFAFVVIFA